jgi:alkylglycerol monooxygenase
VENWLIAAAIPIFMLAIAIELLINRSRGDTKYRFEDTVTNLSCGVGQQVTSLYLKVILIGLYVWLYNHVRIYTISISSVLSWVVLVLAVDCLYYWFHRASHRINWIWATHVVHHQSEEYNLSVALRQSWLQGVASILFYLPLAILGFSPKAFVLVSTLNTLYQFWIHTRSIKRLGMFEWVFNTPSHHRVHHGVNRKYLDKNYAGMLIIWDRLFGTFEPETEEPAYGIVKPLRSYNPWWANVHYWVDLWKMFVQASGFIEKISVWFLPPDRKPASLGGQVVIPEITRDSQELYLPQSPQGARAYAAVQGSLAIGSTLALLVLPWKIPAWLHVGWVLWILLTLAVLGAFFERKPWVWWVEPIRVLAALGLVSWPLLHHNHAWWATGLITLFAISTIPLLAKMRQRWSPTRTLVGFHEPLFWT